MPGPGQRSVPKPVPMQGLRKPAPKLPLPPLAAPAPATAKSTPVKSTQRPKVTSRWTTKYYWATGGMPIIDFSKIKVGDTVYQIVEDKRVPVKVTALNPFTVQPVADTK